MWDEARQIVKSVFFGDEIELFEESFVENSIGEEIPELVSVGTFPCNIQNAPAAKKETISGGSMPQNIRVSLSKQTPLDTAKTYVLRIKKARISFTPEDWKVTSWTEAQISTVLQASREVSI